MMWKYLFPFQAYDPPELECYMQLPHALLSLACKQVLCLMQKLNPRQHNCPAPLLPLIQCPAAHPCTLLLLLSPICPSKSTQSTSQAGSDLAAAVNEVLALQEANRLLAQRSHPVAPDSGTHPQRPLQDAQVRWLYA
jgi:hypothetical protein